MDKYEDIVAAIIAQGQAQPQQQAPMMPSMGVTPGQEMSFMPPRGAGYHRPPVEGPYGLQPGMTVPATPHFGQLESYLGQQGLGGGYLNNAVRSQPGFMPGAQDAYRYLDPEV